MISVGIDVSKGKSTICILKPYGEIVRSPFDVQHTNSGLESLVQILEGLDEEFRIAMEATGAYHYPKAIIVIAICIFTTIAAIVEGVTILLNGEKKYRF